MAETDTDNIRRMRRGFIKNLAAALVVIGIATSLVAVGQAREPAPKFFANQRDNNHCLQASLLIVLNSLGYKAGWNEVNRLTQYQDGLYSWTVQGAAALAKFIPNARLVSVLDYRKFAAEGERYLEALWPADWLALQKRNASPKFAKEQAAAATMVGLDLFTHKDLTQQELFDALDDHLVIAMVSTSELYGSDLGAHFVVLYAREGGLVSLHDPGLPPRASQRLPEDKVFRAFAREAILIPTNGRKFAP